MDTTLNDHVTYQTKPLDLRNQRIYCVKVKPHVDLEWLHAADILQAGVNSLLDVARQTYKEANADATELIKNLSGNLKMCQFMDRS